MIINLQASVVISHRMEAIFGLLVIEKGFCNHLLRERLSCYAETDVNQTDNGRLGWSVALMCVKHS
ncbi:hypothetical protein T03_17822 [Trichinella britovi]|uniref:Uncharacterized protein n=2 Tax=Trichinella TaxID=6333 RepID=A0A0V1D2Z7_TRIBR|nr:hypothetical protein T03_17822 [Trichinella britovi]